MVHELFMDHFYLKDLIMYKLCMALLLSVTGQTWAMMDHIEDLKRYTYISAPEKKAWYKAWKRYFNSSEGKMVILYPPRGEFKFPSRKTYLLHIAIALGDVNQVEKILKRNGKRVVAHISYESNTLNFAIKCGNQKIVELIRNKGSNIVMLPTKKCFMLEKRQTQEEIDMLKGLLFPSER